MTNLIFREEVLPVIQESYERAKAEYTANPSDLTKASMYVYSRRAYLLALQMAYTMGPV